jgi:alpha-mannosidase
VVTPSFTWRGTNVFWLRAKITVPAEMAGVATTGLPIRLELGFSNQCGLYVDGQLRDNFRGDGGEWVLTNSAAPGQVFYVAIRVHGQRHNRFHFARLYCDALPDFERYLDELTFVTGFIKEATSDEQTVLKNALDASEGCIQFEEVTPNNLEEAKDQLAKARAALLPVADITRKYDVYYVGHAHIDMNWLWTWPETIDTCRRTWNSAMNLMDQFPDFDYVQSQPGAYVPIEEKYPDEFARMQKMSAEGQWDIVGGMWDESDTDIPSGEGLARSFMLGQEYFKAKFGKYAVTGWLPDSFGHTWQLPQIMQLAGEKYFYHMRCGNGMPLTWWESPDGSRVLKANTAGYDAKPQLEQMLEPMENGSRFNMPESVVIFGVGDHGGGPTREQILHIKAFQDDPIFPKVHFISADDFFDQLAQQPTAAELPVLDNDLQYTFEGCYTTHADMKKALRKGENNLYSAEVLSSLAAMNGQPYPTEAFDEAWKPTTFAQFHDIAAGSAIHSTYDWMHEQLAPAEKFEQEQTDQSLETLTANADTRGPGTMAIAVWNTLSFARDDVVKVAITNAGKYHCVLDNAGHQYPAQALDDNTLVFVARNVPAFGHQVYFPNPDVCPSDGVKLQDAGDNFSIHSPTMELEISKKTGALARLYSETAHWNVFGGAQDGNALELLGDNGSAWIIRYTNSDDVLTTEGASVSVLDNGPVFSRVRVSHAYGKSTYTQDVIVYGALDRVDIPTTVNWQEHGQLLKIRLPATGAHLEANAQIPYGSKERPINGQECPGQKWMDVSETTPMAVHDATPLDLSGLFNACCLSNFDGEGASYPGEGWPGAGTHRLGVYEVPFNLPGYHEGVQDNVFAAAQTIAIPADATGNTLYLLGARSLFNTGTDIGFQFADGRTEFRAFELNNWKVNTYPDNEVGYSFGTERPHNKRRNLTAASLWITAVPIPAGATALVLPNDKHFHLFAATIASEPNAPAMHGLSVLNDCKYGFDVKDGVFRLTALRSSDHPDPTPDQGMQEFTYSLYPHAGNWAAAQTDERALGLNIPLLAVVTTAHAATGQMPALSIENTGGKGDLIVTALKRSEDGNGYILRFYEADGQDTEARIDFDQPMHVEETDILERPLPNQTVTVQGNSATLPVGHNRIVTLRFMTGS